MHAQVLVDAGLNMPTEGENFSSRGFHTVEALLLQALGRLLTMEDISKDLKGRRAELWWPDDSLWYLIEIHDVDIPLKKAHITYVTGETEVLDLLDIVREGHMSLISGENHRVPY